MLPDYEKLGVFYLGERVDQAGTGSFLLRSSDLCTHGVVIGMTGSGKTGLSVALLEEAALDGIPCIAIDPKGDLANLALTFPALRPEDFAPWAPPGRAPEAEAETWRKGLEATGQDGARIQRLRDAADVRIYTPGARHGLPVSVLGSLAPPRGASDEELHEAADATARSLLALLSGEGDDRAHVLLAHILLGRWSKGETLDLPALVHAVQEPGVARVGAMDLETFFPKKERFALALSLNTLLASPGFDAWLEGAPLDLDALLFGPGGKPAVSVFSIAHLSDERRMFFVTQLLSACLRWMRRQPGTSSLRALLFMDEIAGYFPPVAAPPSKAPLLSLLKQARAFGLGVVLATQNPVDLDYKGLANAGTWFVGRLQTDRDRMRVLDGLEGALAQAGLERSALEETLAALPPRTFVVHSVHGERPALLKSRFALSYLRGPLTREEMGRLKGAITTPTATATSTPTSTSTATPTPTPTSTSTSGDAGPRPVLPPGIDEVFLPSAAGAVLRPHVLGMARVVLRDAKVGVDVTRDVAFAAPIPEPPLPLEWDEAVFVPAQTALGREPPAGARFVPLPRPAALPKSYPAWAKTFTAWLARTQGTTVLACAELGAFSMPGEDETAFRRRLVHAVHERRDARIAKLDESYGPKLRALVDRLERAEAELARKQEEARLANVSTAMSVATGVAQIFLGRSARRATGTALRSAQRRSRDAASVAKKEDSVAELRARFDELQAELRTKMSAVAAEADPARLALEEVVVRPKRGAVELRLVALAWRA